LEEAAEHLARHRYLHLLQTIVGEQVSLKTKETGSNDGGRLDGIFHTFCPFAIKSNGVQYANQFVVKGVRPSVMSREERDALKTTDTHHKLPQGVKSKGGGGTVVVPSQKVLTLTVRGVNVGGGGKDKGGATDVTKGAQFMTEVSKRSER